MLIRTSLVAAFTLCLTLSGLPATAQSIDLNARIDIGLPSVAIFAGGERQYFRRSPGWGYGRNKRGWYRLDTQPGGFVVYRGRQYYQSSPGWGYEPAGGPRQSYSRPEPGRSTAWPRG